MNFIKEAVRTESIPDVVMTRELTRLLHASIGMQTESAEFSDQLKKHIFYGKPLDKVNLKEEIGDLLWYLAIALDTLDSSFEVEMLRVIKKLKVRYPDKFSNELAASRRLEEERKVLEGQTQFDFHGKELSNWE